MINPLSAGELPTVAAEKVGMSSERLKRVSDVSQEFVSSGQAPGLITMVARRGKIVHFKAYGTRGLDDDHPLEKTDIFRLYSMTKPVAAVAMMQLYEKGAFHMQDPVAKFVPELSTLKVYKDGKLEPLKKVMTIQHLLTHTSGLSHGIDPANPVDKRYIDAKIYQSKDLEEFAEKIGRAPLLFEPGVQWHYSVGLDIAGLIVQRISGKSFDQYLEDHLFGPLNMVDTAFYVPQEKIGRFLPLHYIDEKDGKLKVFDQNNVEASSFNAIFAGGCAALCDYENVTLFAGSGGLVSTARDYMRFAEMLRNGGALDGVRILGPKTVEYMTLDHLPAVLGEREQQDQPTVVNAPEWMGFGMGVGVVKDATKMGIIGSNGEYFWTGGTGPAFWVDPVEDIVVVGLMQKLTPWPDYQPNLKTATYQSITELNK